MGGSADDAVAAPPADPGAVELLEKELGIGSEAAESLVRRGYGGAAEVRALNDEDLRSAGLSSEDIRHVRTVRGGPPTSTDGQQIVQRWIQSVRKPSRARKKPVVSQTKGSREVLRKWVDGDDRAMEAWIQSSEPAKVPTASSASATSETGAAPAGSAATTTSIGSGTAIPSVRSVEGISPQILEREETVVRWLTDLLDRVKTEEFDPASLLQEVQELHRQLHEERSRRKQLDDELEHVKRGSIAVIKYVRSREAKVREQAVMEKDAEIAELKLKLISTTEGLVTVPAAPGSVDPAVREAASREAEAKVKEEFEARERSYIERETDLRRRVVQLEGEIRNLRSEAELVKKRGDSGTTSEGGSNASLRLKELDQRERDLVLRENELRSKFEEIRINAEELGRKAGPLQFKEKELSNWEQHLQMTKQALELEARRVEQARMQLDAAGTTPAVASEAKRLEDLKNEINRKEEEVRARETFLHQKMAELEELQGKVAQAEAERMHTDLVEQVRTEGSRLRSGVRRLDDLLFGGLPPGCQILVNAPAHTGKEVLARLFVAEGLRSGIPAIWVITDKTWTTIREEMELLLPTYAQFEAKGLVRYVDLYARSLGVTQAEPIVKLLNATDKTVTEQVTQAVNQFSQEVKEKATGYRLVFESVSTLTAYLDTTSTFRFLQPFAGRRKLDGAAAYYLLETGMHSESDLQTLEHMMDGSISLKVDQLKTFLSVRGITDVQSRAWVGYTFSKKSFNLGSFSLDHIR